MYIYSSRKGTYHREETEKLLKASTTLTGVAEWAERHPANQKLSSSISQSGHMPELQARLLTGGVLKATN